MLLLCLSVALQSPRELIAQVDASRMRENIAHLSSMPNRNTNNTTLTEAARYIADQYRQIPGLQVEIMKYLAPKGQRVPIQKEVVEVVATLPGFTDRKVIIGGHFDSINMVERTNLEAAAPGANDDLSGMSQALECARVMARRKWKNTLVFVAFSGEEQGLLGSTALAKRAKAENWKIDAVLSDDIVGSSRSLNGQSDRHHVRVFSEESPKHNSRELARFIEWNSRGKIPGFSPKLVFRRDRFQRGGDHSSFNAEGYTAVRFTEPYEEFTRQHTKEDLIQYVDFDFLANVARLNLYTAATLAEADPAPTDVRYDPKQAHDTIIRWAPVSGSKFVVYWRDTTSPIWQRAITVDAGKGEITIPKVNKDDTIFAVGSIGGVPVEAK